MIFRATPQWFISMDQAGLRENTLRDIKKVQWTPAWGEQRITGMIETGRTGVSRVSAPGACRSRCSCITATGELHPRSAELIDTVAARVEKAGIDAWFALDPAELLGAEAEQYDKVTDVMDVWADSGLSLECVSKHRPESPRRSTCISKARTSIAAGSTARC